MTELINVPESDSLIVIAGKLNTIQWKTKEGELIYIRDLEDSHLRNIALMLMGFGYQKFVTSNEIRVKWLTILRMEWERRITLRKLEDHD